MGNPDAGEVISKGECPQAAASEPDCGACKLAPSGIEFYIRATGLLCIAAFLLAVGTVAAIAFDDRGLRDVLAGAVVLLSTAMALAVFFGLRPRVKKLSAQERLRDEAIGNLSQGLIMFDASERVVLCNRRYIEMSGLPPEFVQPGRTLREIVCRR